jgi:hypothetical protein
LSVKRLRVGLVIIFIIGIILVALGVYSIYYFISIGYGRPTFLFGGLGSIAFGIVLLRASFPIFVPLKKYFNPAKSCPNCGAIVTEDEVVCEKCKQQIDTSEIKN